MGVCACECRFLQRPEGSGVPGAVVTGSDEASVCWETNSGPLDEQYMLVAAEPSFISNACREQEKDGFFDERLTLV